MYFELSPKLASFCGPHMLRQWGNSIFDQSYSNQNRKPRQKTSLYIPVLASRSTMKISDDI
jgi:hypothetical protein